MKDLEAKVTELEIASQRQLEENTRLKRNLLKLEEENNILKGSNFTFTFPVCHPSLPHFPTHPHPIHSIPYTPFTLFLLVCANGSNLTSRENKRMEHLMEIIPPLYPIGTPSKKPVEQNHQILHFIPPIYQCSISTN